MISSISPFPVFVFFVGARETGALAAASVVAEATGSSVLMLDREGVGVLLKKRRKSVEPGSARSERL